MIYFEMKDGEMIEHEPGLACNLKTVEEVKEALKFVGYYDIAYKDETGKIHHHRVYNKHVADVIEL